MANPIVSPLLRWLGRLSFPRLFLLAATLFLLDLLVPDFIPFADEILLGLGTLLLSRWKKPAGPETIDGKARRRA